MSDIKEEPVMIATEFLIIKDAITGNIITQNTAKEKGSPVSRDQKSILIY